LSLKGTTGDEEGGRKSAAKLQNYVDTLFILPQYLGL